MYRSTTVDLGGGLDYEHLRGRAERHGAMTPAEIGRTLGLSEQAVCSIVGMLAEAGKVRITSVERIG